MKKLPWFGFDDIAHQLTDAYWTDFARIGSPKGPIDGSDDGQVSVDLTQLGADGQRLARQALEAWSVVTGLTFLETTAGTGADILFGNDNDGAYNATLQLDVDRYQYINVPKRWLKKYPSGFDSYNFLTYIHEIGHALGLGHAGNYNLKAVYRQDRKGDNHFLNDSWQATVMSYFSQTENTAVKASYAFAVTPMMADLLAVRQLYNHLPITNNDADTIYTLKADGTHLEGLGLKIGRNTIALTIFDTGGVDTLDFSSTGQNQRIDLHSGTFSNVGGGRGNFAIDVESDIEHAVGGRGVDQIIGNQLANTLTGGLGRDKIWGNDEADTLKGGGGADDLFGGRGDDQLTGGNGNDLIKGGGGSDTLIFAGDRDVTVKLHRTKAQHTGWGKDKIRSIENVTTGGGDDRLVGNDRDNRLNAGMGDDKLTGGGGADVFVFDRHSGMDIITDFSLNEDRIGLAGWNLTGFADLTLVADDLDTIIRLGPEHEIRLRGVNPADLDTDYFIF